MIGMMIEAGDQDAKQTLLDLAGAFHRITDYTDGDGTNHIRSEYYAAVAKIVNVWRAAGNPVKIWEKWFEEFPNSTNRPKRLPPRALRGRWAAIHEWRDALSGLSHHHRLWCSAER